MIDYRENLFIQRRLLIFNMVCMTKYLGYRQSYDHMCFPKVNLTGT